MVATPPRPRLLGALRSLLEAEAGFSEADHPRWPAGDPRGGKFAPKGGAGGQALLKPSKENRMAPPPGAVGFVEPPVGGATGYFDGRMQIAEEEPGRLVGAGSGARWRGVVEMVRHAPHWLGVRYSNQREALAAADAALKGNKFYDDEVAYIVKDGVILFAVRGTSQQIDPRSWPKHVKDLMRGADFTHSHPGGAATNPVDTLSGADLSAAYDGGYRIRAISPTSDSVWEFEPATFDRPRQAGDQGVAESIRRAKRVLLERISPAVDEGSIFTSSQARESGRAILGSIAIAMAHHLRERGLGTLRQVARDPHNERTLRRMLSDEAWRAVQDRVRERPGQFLLAYDETGAPILSSKTLELTEGEPSDSLGLVIDDREHFAFSARGWRNRPRPTPARRRLRGALARMVEAKGGFSEADHPRHPAGSPQGGKFAPKGPGGGALRGGALQRIPYVSGAGAPRMVTGDRGPWDTTDTEEMDEASRTGYARRAMGVLGAENELRTPGRAEALKDSAVDRLAKRAGVSYNVANRLVGQWAISANDSDMRSLAIQRDIAAEFGLALSPWQQDKLRRLEKEASFMTTDSRAAVVNEMASAAYRLARQFGGRPDTTESNHSLGQEQGDFSDLFGRYSSLLRHSIDEYETAFGPPSAKARDLRDAMDGVVGAVLGLHAPGGGEALREAAANLVHTMRNQMGADGEEVDRVFLGARETTSRLRPLTDSASQRRLLRAMYDLTQEDLKAKGIESLLVFRGSDPAIRRAQDGSLVWRKMDIHAVAAIPHGALLRTPGSAAASYSASATTASRFGHLLSVRRVRREEVLSTPLTGSGCLHEAEFVVLGTPDGHVYERRSVFTGDHVVPVSEARARVKRAASRLAVLDLDMSSGENADWLHMAAPKAMAKEQAIHAELGARRPTMAPRRRVREALRRALQEMVQASGGTATSRQGRGPGPGFTPPPLSGTISHPHGSKRRAIRRIVQGLARPRGPGSAKPKLPKPPALPPLPGRKV